MSSTPGEDKKIMAGILGIVPSLFGFGGIHRFFLGDIAGGIIRLLLILACGIGPIISIIEGILYLTKSEEDFLADYVDGDKAWF